MFLNRLLVFLFIMFICRCDEIVKLRHKNSVKTEFVEFRSENNEQSIHIESTTVHNFYFRVSYDVINNILNDNTAIIDHFETNIQSNFYAMTIIFAAHKCINDRRINAHHCKWTNHVNYRISLAQLNDSIIRFVYFSIYCTNIQFSILFSTLLPYLFSYQDHFLALRMEEIKYPLSLHRPN